MSVFDHITPAAQAARRTIVLPEGHDFRIVEAAAAIVEQGIADILLLGEPQACSGIARNLGISPGLLNIVDPDNDDRHESYAQALLELRHHKGMTLESARQAVRNPLMFGTMMVRHGSADGYVAGAANTTGDVLRAALQVIGMAPHCRLVSSFFIMEHELPHQAIQGTVLYADCAMVIEPGAEELAEIAITTAQSAVNLLGMDPVVALLSFSTAGSASHPKVSKVQDAGAIIARSRPDLKTMAEVQFDAALVQDILASKAPGIKTRSPANILVFPELQSANIGYKIAERIGGVTATGPILQGLARPVNDLSRGCSVQDIIRLVTITAVQAQETRHDC